MLIELPQHEELTDGIAGAFDHFLHFMGALTWTKLVFFVAAILFGIFLWRRK